MSALETVKQMKERELERKRLQEEKDREGQEIIRRIQEIQQEDNTNNLLKKTAAKNIFWIEF